MAAAAILTSCDPVSSTFDFEPNNYSAQQVSDCITFKVYKDEACTQEAGPAEGNYVKYTTSPATIVSIVQQSGESEKVLANGASGTFVLSPKRGSAPEQELIVRVLNSDNTTVDAKKTLSVFVKSDLEPELKLLCSDSGTKVWKWNTKAPDGICWGNLGNWGGFDGKDFALTGNNKWWGVGSPEELANQLGHSDTGVTTGEESAGATMVFTEDGEIFCYDEKGDQIRKGTFTVEGYDPTYAAYSGECVGYLVTSPGAILFPFEINANGNKPTRFEIFYLSPGRLCLGYPDTGEWKADKNNEGTFWQFYSETDIKGCLTDNSSATWTWIDTEGVPCWGNGGYSGFATGGFGSITGNQWWGVDANGIAEQISGYGYGSQDVAGATMTFNADGTLTKSSGGKGEWSFTLDTEDLGGYKEGKTWGRLNTTGDGILFNQRINANDHADLPSTISNFDIVYVDDDNLVLTSPSFFKSTGGESWQEGTFWRFKKVK